MSRATARLRQSAALVVVGASVVGASLLINAVDVLDHYWRVVEFPS